MTHIVVLAHKPLASALREVAAHTFPDCAAEVDAMDVDAATPPDAVAAALRTQLAQCGSKEVLILVDVFGATPCNVALSLADGSRVRVVSGVNVPMLWRTLCYREESLESLVERAMAGAVQGVMHVAEPRRQNQARPAEAAADDQVHLTHQQ